MMSDGKAALPKSTLLASLLAMLVLVGLPACFVILRRHSAALNDNSQRLSRLERLMIANRDSRRDVEDILGSRYYWLPPLQAKEFAIILGSIDLMISANISATTATLAIVSEIPVVILKNSLFATTLEEGLAAARKPPCPYLYEWLSGCLPIYPFTLWPIGWYRFLQPMLIQNEYLHAVVSCELLDEAAVLESCSQLLFSSKFRTDQIEKQVRYVRGIQGLPTAAELLEGVLG